MPTSVYNAAKAAVVSLTKSASSEYGRKGIRVNCLCPGFIETEIMGASGGSNFPQMYEKASLGRAGRPEEVAEVAAFLVLGPGVVRERRDHPRRRRLVRPTPVTPVDHGGHAPALRQPGPAPARGRDPRPHRGRRGRDAARHRELELARGDRAGGGRAGRGQRAHGLPALRQRARAARRRARPHRGGGRGRARVVHPRQPPRGDGADLRVRVVVPDPGSSAAATRRWSRSPGVSARGCAPRYARRCPTGTSATRRSPPRCSTSS